MKLRYACCALALLGPAAALQSGSLVLDPLAKAQPAPIVIKTTGAPIRFKINDTNYPPMHWPAWYESEFYPVDITVNTNGSWQVNLEFRDIVNSRGKTIVSAGKIFYRLEGDTRWFKGKESPQLLVNYLDAKGAKKLKVNVQFGLKLDGDEPAGRYEADLAFSSLVLP